MIMELIKIIGGFLLWVVLLLFLLLLGRSFWYALLEIAAEVCNLSQRNKKK
ncbi:hypothetical protein PYCH_15230 [Pyrococcus yayanosii CH1]|uniref:Uncharacterized protein n=1 Tax=Pyrococcus yayanosii (strain CH1 / JCM 16557) TaxID=529709 RepID=F8AGI6_PYRYC|nr:hypothetical protein PYCH_15230 [Pyrococcus yayanosii CH1]